MRGKQFKFLINFTAHLKYTSETFKKYSLLQTVQEVKLQN